jgi:hypothetical protein
MAVAVVGVGMVAEAVAAFTVEAVEAVFTAEAVGLLGLTAGVVAGMAEAAGFTDLLPMVARPISVMGGVVMH